MEFFDKIGDKISSKSKDVAKKAKNITDLTKLNSRIHDFEKMIKDSQAQIGKIYFEANTNNPGTEYMELFQNIINAQGEIIRCKEEIIQIKGIKNCAGCGAEIPNEAVFCPSCGIKNEIIDVSYTEESEEEIACPGCGAGVSADTAFCSKCGTKVK